MNDYIIEYCCEGEMCEATVVGANRIVALLEFDDIYGGAAEGVQIMSVRRAEVDYD